MALSPRVLLCAPVYNTVGAVFSRSS